MSCPLGATRKGINMGKGEVENVTGKIVFKSVNALDWEVHDFFALPKESFYCFRSPSFQYLNGSWCLQCYPNGRELTCIALSLKNEHSYLDYTITFELGIKRKGEEKYITRNRKAFFKSIGSTRSINLYLDRKDLLEDKLIVAPHDVITFFCILSPVPATRNSIKPKGVDVVTGRTEEGNGNLSKDLKNSKKESEEDEVSSKEVLGTEKVIQSLKDAFITGEHHDTTIRVQDQEFGVHKFILSIRSPVFDAMFRHEMSEHNTGVITIEDCDPEAFKEFLSFLYTGKLENVSVENVTDIYYIADKYQEDEVKSKCVKFMIHNLAVDNFCGFISLSLRHGEANLLKKAIGYFKRNAKNILITRKWLSFHKEYPVESNELYIKALTYTDPD